MSGANGNGRANGGNGHAHGANGNGRRNNARYEFRVFGPDLRRTAARLARLMDEAGTSESANRYLLLPRVDKINIKIRDGALDLKRRITVAEGFEQWRPEGRHEFPLKPSEVELFPRLEGEELDPDELLIKLREAKPGFHCMHVLKTRTHYERDGLSGEYGRLLVNGSRLETLAIEGSHLDHLVSLRSELELDGFLNVSYVLELKRIAGMTPMPQGSPYRADRASVSH